MINANLLLFGETHGYLGEDVVRNIAIKQQKPNYILYELLEDQALHTRKEKEEFLRQPDKKQFSIISTYGELKPLIQISLELNIPIIGCDLKNTGRKDINFKEDEEELMRKRQNHQYKIIKKYKKRGKVFVSIGLYHLLPQSKLIQKLQGNYYLLLPYDKNNNIFGTKSKSKNVIYKIVNHKYEIKSTLNKL